MESNLAVVIPCYRAKETVLDVIGKIPACVRHIIVVDDACPDETGEHVKLCCSDDRIIVLTHERNLGVGGAMQTGYQRAALLDVVAVVKVDADGQIDPSLIPTLSGPVLAGAADYTKGNRFYDIDSLKGMPLVRAIGNGLLSLVNKLVSGYWDIMDPTNGFTCVHIDVLRSLPLAKISNDYFFESDMLFRLSTFRAVVRDVPMRSSYGSEESSLSIWKVLFTFPGRYFNRFFKRIVYNYFVRDFNGGSLQLVSGLSIFFIGVTYGAIRWFESAHSGEPSATGEVMLAALPVLVGVNLLIAAMQFDIQNIPVRPIHSSLPSVKLDQQNAKGDDA